FSTYASWWIKHAIRNGIRQTREIVHIPAKFRDLSARWQREATRQQTASGIPMTPQEIAAAMSVSQATECKVRRSLAQHFSGCTPSLPVAAEHALPDTRELAPDGRLMQREEEVNEWLWWEMGGIIMDLSVCRLACEATPCRDQCRGRNRSVLRRRCVPRLTSMNRRRHEGSGWT
ncbi:MAG: hypothetical protein ACK58T_38495, partial [Phycisphaerae bacterium]